MKLITPLFLFCKSALGMKKSLNQLCLGIIASEIGFVLRPADVFCAKA